jgi:hypothetical protein
LNVRHARKSPDGDAAGGYMPEPVDRAIDLDYVDYGAITVTVTDFTDYGDSNRFPQ